MNYSRNLLVALVVAVLTLACHEAEAQVKPFKVTGGGTAPDGLSLFGAASPHNATGTATHLGNYSGDEGIAKVLTVDFATLTGTFHGTFVFVAANGDRLACNYGDPGTFAVTPSTEVAGEFVVEFVAEFTPDPALSTGQFANVTGGSFTMTATTESFAALDIDADGFTPPFAYTWEGSGSLTFNEGN